MRTFLILTAGGLAFAAPAAAATRNFGITSFTKIRVDGPFKVTLMTGVAPFATASGSSTALDRVAIDVRGDTLVVHPSTASWGGFAGDSAGPVEIRLGTHELSSAWLNGSGMLLIDRVKGLAFALSVQGSGRVEIGAADSDQMNVGISGSGSAKVAGRAKKLTAVVRGVSALDAAGLSSTDATIGAEGAATIDANVSNSATVAASGPATVRLTGRPSCTLTVAGSTTVSGCR